MGGSLRPCGGGLGEAWWCWARDDMCVRRWLRVVL